MEYVPDENEVLYEDPVPIWSDVDPEYHVYDPPPEPPDTEELNVTVCPASEGLRLEDADTVGSELTEMVRVLELTEYPVSSCRFTYT